MEKIRKMLRYTDNKIIIIAVATLVIIVVVITALLIFNKPDDLKVSGLNNERSDQTTIEESDETNRSSNISLEDKLDQTFHKEFGEGLDTKELKEMRKFTGRVIKQPVEEVEEVGNGLFDLIDKDSNIEYDGDGNKIEIKEANDNKFDDPLLKMSNKAVLYKIQMYINGEIKNNGYLSLLTKSKTDKEHVEERNVSYSVTLASAKESVSYIHYYNRIIKQTNSDNKALLASWDKVYKEVVKYKEIIDNINSIEDVPTYREDLNKLKLVSVTDSFVREALKYIGDYNPYEESEEVKEDEKTGDLVENKGDLVENTGDLVENTGDLVENNVLNIENKDKIVDDTLIEEGEKDDTQ